RILRLHLPGGECLQATAGGNAGRGGGAERRGSGGLRQRHVQCATVRAALGLLRAKGRAGRRRNRTAAIAMRRTAMIACIRVRLLLASLAIVVTAAAAAGQT